MSQLRTRRELAALVDSASLSDGPEAYKAEPRGLSALVARLPCLPATRKGVRIIRADDNADFFDAEQALEATKAEMKRLKVDISTAMDQGREEGYAEGREQANQELAEEIHRAQHQLVMWQQEARETIVDLAVKIASKLVGTIDVEEATRKGIISQVVKHMSDGPYTLQVASDMLPVARTAIKDIEADHPNVPVPTLRLDSRLPEGRAVLVTRFGSVDLDLQAQLEAIRVSLLKGNGSLGHQSGGQAHS